MSKNEYTNIGRVTEFKFSAEIGRAFRGHNALKWLVNWGPAWGMLSDDKALVFVDNHDNQVNFIYEPVSYLSPIASWLLA